MVASFAATMLATIPVLLGNGSMSTSASRRERRGSRGGGRRKDGRKKYGRKWEGGRRKVGEAGLPPSPLSPVYKVFLESTLKETFKQIYKHKHTYTVDNFTCNFLQH